MGPAFDNGLMPPADAKATSPPPPAPSRSRWLQALSWITLTYAAVIVFLWYWMYGWGDRGWLATIFLFGPRWFCAIPWPMLFVAAAIWQRRLLVPLALAGLVILFPIMGLELNFAGGSNRLALRLVTCNVDQFRYSAERLLELIEDEQIDAVLLQEVAGRAQFVWPRGWNVIHRDEYLLASRFPIRMEGDFRRPTIPGKMAAVRFLVDMPGRGEVQFFDLHLPTPRYGLEAVLNQKTVIEPEKAVALESVLAMREREASLVSRWIASFDGPKIVVGDFNMPRESVIFRKHFHWLDNAFSRAGLGFGFTKITEEKGLNYGSRIDHVLYSPPWKCVKAWVGPPIGSDHLPLVVEFE